MLAHNLWDQDSWRGSVAGCELRYLRYVDYLRITEAAGLTAEVMRHCMFLQTKRTLGQQLAP